VENFWGVDEGTNFKLNGTQTQLCAKLTVFKCLCTKSTTS